jgi:predicted aconitase with swiveling domain
MLGGLDQEMGTLQNRSFDCQTGGQNVRSKFFAGDHTKASVTVSGSLLRSLPRPQVAPAGVCEHNTEGGKNIEDI